MIVRTIEEDSELSISGNWIQCFRGTNLIRTTISVGVFACQHLSGIVFALGFSTYFFELAGIPLNHAFDLGVGVTACGVVGVVISWSVINTVGRRKLFVWGMIGMTIVMVLMGILDVVHTSAARWVQASCTVIYALIYQITIGVIAFALLGEVSTPALRAKTIGLATACQAVFGTLMNIVVPYMVSPQISDFPLRENPVLNVPLTFLPPQGQPRQGESQRQSRLRVWRCLSAWNNLELFLYPGIEGPHLPGNRLLVPPQSAAQEDGQIQYRGSHRHRLISELKNLWERREVATLSFSHGN